MWTQPVLTANGTIGTDEFAVLSGGGADSTAWQAFDNSVSSYCNAMNNGAWIEFYSKNPLEISSITITSSTQALPSIGIFQVSYDGNAWEDVQQWEDVDQTASSAQINLETPIVGNYFRLLSQGRSIVKPDNNADIGNVIITAEEVCQPVSISRTLSNNSFGDKYITHYLPFDNSTTENIRGNDWTENGTLSISENNAINGKALQLNNSYLSYTNGTFLGGQDFTIRLSFCITSFNGNWQRIVTLFNTVNSDKDCVSFRRDSTTSNYYIENFGTSSNKFSLSTNTIYQFEWDYSHSESLSRIFINGELKTTLNKSIPRTKFNIIYLGKSEYTADGLWTGSIDEFMIIDGFALNKKNFTNPDNIKWDDIKTNITKLYPLSDFLIFTGNSGSYATIPTNILTSNTSFTAEFKISSTSTKSSDNNYQMPTIFGIEISGNNQNDFGFCINNGKLAYWAEPIWTPSTQALRILTDYFVSDGKPHIISFVSELSKSVKIYCDGKLVHENNNYNITIPYNSVLYIGSNTTSNAPLAMKFYEARFWSKALTQEEIFANIDGTEEGLEAWYKTSSNDLSNHNRNLTLNNVLYYQYKEDSISENADIQIKVLNSVPDNSFDISADIQYTVYNITYNCKVYLPFDKSPTEDLCGNEWISFYDPTIKNNALQTDGFCHLKMKNTIALGDQDFTIHGWFNVSNNRKNNSSIFSLHKTEKSNVDRISIKNTDNTSTMQLIVFDTTSNFSITPNIFHHFSIVYNHSSSKIILFIDGIQTLTMSKTIPLTDFTLEISHSPYMNYYGSLGSIKNFTINETILWQSNYTTSLSEFYTPLDLYFRQKQEIDINCDIIKKTKNNNINQFLTCYLPFNNSPTEDLAGNVWTIKEGTAVISEDNAFSSSALQLDGTGYLQSYTPLFLGGKDFTIDCWCYPLNTNTNYNRIWEIRNSSDQIIGVNFPSATQIRLNWIGTTYTYTFKLRNQLIHVALVYQHKNSLVSLYINGIKVCQLSKTLELTQFPTFYIGQYTGGGNYRFKGTIDEFRVYNGIARWTENFVVPKSNDYSIENIVVLPTIDKYIWFDGTSYASTPTGLLSGARIFTLEIKFVTTDINNNYYRDKSLLGIDKSSMEYGFFNLGIIDGKLHLWRCNANNQSVIIKTDKIINDNKKHTVSLVNTIENGNYQLYLYCDGEELYSDTTDIKIAENSSIGIAFTGNSDYRKTKMKFYEARFWSKALTQEEIFANIDGTEEGLEAWYIPENNILKDKSIKQQNPYNTGRSYFYKNYIANYQCSIIYETTNNVKPNDNIYLPLIDSPTNDLYNHQWSNIHSSTISDYALQLNGTDQFITANNKINLGGQDFTIEFYLTKLGGTSSGPVFSIYYDETHFMTLNNEGWYINYTKTDSMPTGHKHVAFVYKNDTQTIYYYLNGSLVNSRTTTIFNTSKKFIVDLGSNSWGTSWRTQFWKGSIEHFHINTSEALYDDAFDPLLDRDHGLDIGFQSSTDKIPLYIYNKIDVKVRNKSLTYRYENQGTAEDLSVFGKTCTWNEDNRTNTGISFSQTERKKCFDIPSEKQIWIRFDLYHIDSKSRFRVYNEITDKVSGLCNSGSEIRLYNYGTQVFSSSDVKKDNVLQSWLLYMRSDTSVGEIVLWCDGQEITRYTGNVNNGEPFNNISMSGETYLWSSEKTYSSYYSVGVYGTEYYTYTNNEPFPYEADLNNYFSNVIISNEEIAVDESLCGNIADIQLNISNITDTENYLMINMPFTSSTTEDLCGNEFTTIGEPRIELSPYMNSNALYLDGTTAIESINTFTFNRNPFTISFEFVAIFSETLNSSEMVLCHFYNENSSIKLNISVEGKVYLLVNNASMTSIVSEDTIGGMEHFVELNYDGAYFYLFVDGKKIKFSYKVFSEFQPYKLSIGTGDSKYFDGWIRNFKLYQNICIHNDINYDSSDLLLEKEFLNQDTINFNLYVDINVILNNDNWLPALENIRDYLPCDTAPVQTLTNNSWSYNTNGTLSIREKYGNAVNFIGPRGSYNLSCSNIQLGGRDFTIKFWINIDGYPANVNYATTPLFNLFLNNDIVLDFRSLDDFDKQIYILCFTRATRIDFEINKYHLIEYIYRHKEKKIAVYVDKKCIMDIYHQIPETVFNTLGFIKFAWDPEKRNIKLDEIQIYDGISFYNKFVPPTPEHYDRIKNQFLNNGKTYLCICDYQIVIKTYYTPLLTTNLLANFPNNIHQDKAEFDGGMNIINDDINKYNSIIEFPSYCNAFIPSLLDSGRNMSQMLYARKILIGGQDFVIMFDIAFWPDAGKCKVDEFFRLSKLNAKNDSVISLTSKHVSGVIYGYTYMYYYPNYDGNTSNRRSVNMNYGIHNDTNMHRVIIRYNHTTSQLTYYSDNDVKTISNVNIDRDSYDFRIGNFEGYRDTGKDKYYVHYLKNVRIYDGTTVGNKVLYNYSTTKDELISFETNNNYLSHFSFEADINIILVINNGKTINPHKTCLVLYKHFDVDKNITIDPSYNDMTFVTSPLISKYGLSLNHPQKIVDRITLHQNTIMLDFWVYIKNGNGHMIRMYDTNDVFLFGIYNDGNNLCISTPIRTAAIPSYIDSDDLSNPSWAYELDVSLDFGGSYLCLTHKWVSLKIIISSTSIQVLINDTLPDYATFTTGIPDIFSKPKEVYLMVGSDNLEGYINDIRLYDNYYRYRYSEIPTKQCYEQIERQRLSNAYKFYRRVDTEIEVINPERINIVIWHNNQPFKIPFHKAKSRSEVPDNSISFYHNDSVWYSPIVLPTDIEASILRIFYNNTIVSLPTRIHNT